MRTFNYQMMISAFGFPFGLFLLMFTEGGVSFPINSRYLEQDLLKHYKSWVPYTLELQELQAIFNFKAFQLADTSAI